MDSEFRSHWKVVMAAAMGTCCGVTGFIIYSLGIMTQPLEQAFGWSRTEFSASKSFITLGFVMTAPFVGVIADRFGVRKIAMLSLVAYAVAMAAMTQITSDIRIYYAGLLLVALAGSCTTPLVWTRGVATWFERRRGLALGLTLTGSGIAGFLAPPMLSGLMDRWGWQAGYVGMAAAAAFALIPVYFFFFENGRQRATANAPPPSKSVALHTGLSVPEALRSRRFWQIGLAFMLIGGAVSALNVHLVPMLTDGGMARETAVSVAGLLGITVILGRVGTGFLVDRFHAAYVAGISLAAPIIGCMLLDGTGAPLWMLALAAITIGLAAGSEIDLVPYLTARYFGLKAYGKIYGLIFVLFYSGVGIWPLTLGYLYDLNKNYDAALQWTMLVLAIGVALVSTLGKVPTFKADEAPPVGRLAEQPT